MINNKNVFKKIGLFSVATLSLICPSVTKAEKICEIHKNYYFFAELHRSLTTDAFNAKNYLDKTRSTTRTTDLPTTEMEGVEPTTDNGKYKEGIVCLTYTDENNVTITNRGYCTISDDPWTLENFYKKQKDLYKKTAINGIKSIREEETKNNIKTITQYAMNGSWRAGTDDPDDEYDCEQGPCSGGGTNYSSISDKDLAKASYFSTSTEIVTDLVPNESNKNPTGRVTITRELENYSTKYNGYYPTPVNISGYSSILAPELYYLEYKRCYEEGESPTYNATINYYYYKDGKATDERVKGNDGKEIPQYFKEGLTKGKTATIKSEELNGCVIVNKFGERQPEDKSISYTIENSNFYRDVYYRCDTHDVEINYLYYKDGITATKVDFENDVPNPYTEKDLFDGEKVAHTSPKKQGCNIVDASGEKTTEDDEVTIEITSLSPKKITKNVYYSCPSEDEPKENAGTGDALIYFAWAIGLGAIGYSVYYFRRAKKEEV